MVKQQLHIISAVPLPLGSLIHPCGPQALNSVLLFENMAVQVLF
jgi:hypothetical protein